MKRSLSILVADRLNVGGEIISILSMRSTVWLVLDAQRARKLTIRHYTERVLYALQIRTS